MVGVVETFGFCHCCHCHKQVAGWLSGQQAKLLGGANGHHEGDTESELSFRAQHGVQDHLETPASLTGDVSQKIQRK